MMLNPFTTAERRKARALTVARWACALAFAALLLWLGWQPNPYRGGRRELWQAASVVAVAAVGVWVVAFRRGRKP